MQPDPPTSPDQPETHELPSQIPPDDPTSSSLFDWSDFLDFSIDETLNVSYPSESEHPGVDQSQLPDNPKVGRVRKRDPRLVCSNFLAGRIPCACPELDEKLEAEEESGKKRTRTARVSSGATVRCQVAECEADISELKGYHRRHRVCLRCANATSVVIDGESKRYCQQCGKFHVLSDFDEGKRSCRRKLERHNNRRRRKSNDPKEGMQKEPEQVILADCVSADDEIGKDGVSVNSQIEERETLLDSDGRLSALRSNRGLHNLQTDSVVPFAATGAGETPVEVDNQNPKYKPSSSDYDNKSTYSSVCPSGRISFKLYDWNPAEFPRRLRHQIFQWLASMPVELEGYIRPGCTILTAFISMPKPAWHKLLEEPAVYIKDLVSSPGSMLSGRGTMHVHIENMVFRVTRDATSVLTIKVKGQAPKLHYIYPTCFEVGRPMEFVACGSYLLQPNFRFLISLAGRYLSYNISVSSCQVDDANTDNHQLLKIYVPQVNTDLVGPAFIEVENQSGLSNFIPILVSDKETCAEMKILQQQFDIALPFQEQKLSCEVSTLRHAQLWEFILDVGWLLKKPVLEQPLTSTHIKRFNNLLNFLMEKESYAILEKILCSLKNSMDKNLVACVPDCEIRLLRKNMDIAQSRLAKKLTDTDFSVMHVEDRSIGGNSSWNDTLSLVPATNAGSHGMVENVPGHSMSSPSPSLDEGATTPLLKRDVVMNVNLQHSQRDPFSSLLKRTVFTARHLIVAVVVTALCFGICAIALHPQRVSQITMFIMRCFPNNP